MPRASRIRRRELKLTEPRDSLTPPVPEAIIPDLVNLVFLSTADLLSPSAWLLKGISLIPGAKDAFTKTQYSFAGDWNSVLLVANAVKKLGAFNDELAAEVHVANNTCSADWDGKAANAAYEYFETLRSALGKHESALSQASNDLASVAFGMQSQAELVQDLVCALLDWIIVIAASAAAAALASSTGVGAISWAAVALEAYKAGNTTSQLVKALVLIESIVDAVDGLAITYLGAFNANADVKFPGPYDNKLVS